MAQVTIRLSLTQAELLKEVVTAEVQLCKRITTDRDFATVQAGVLDVRAYQRHATARGAGLDAILKELS